MAIPRPADKFFTFGLAPFTGQMLDVGCAT